MTDRSKLRNRQPPEHKPRERTRERIDGGFVLVGGWQMCYHPTPERRAEVLGKAWAARLANEAADRKAQRRQDSKTTDNNQHEADR